MSEVPDLYPGEPTAVRLMNTVWADRAGVHDALRTTSQLEAWWSLIGFASRDPATDTDLAHYRELRGALRRLTAEATGDTREHARRDEPDLATALAVVNTLVAAEPLSLRWGAGQGFTLDWPSPQDGSVSDHLRTVAREAARILASDDSPLRACYGPGCVLYFVREHTRREWCSAGCGNRARVARHYHRTRSGAATPRGSVD